MDKGESFISNYLFLFFHKNVTYSSFYFLQLNIETSDMNENNKIVIGMNLADILNVNIINIAVSIIH